MNEIIYDDENRRPAHRPDRYTKDEIESAVLQSEGIKARAQEILGCTNYTLNRYLLKYPELNELFKAQRQTTIDEMEQLAIEIIRDTRDTDLLKFFLRTQAGWNDKQAGNQTNVQINNWENLIKEISPKKDDSITIEVEDTGW